jgi:hypothetical protein
VGIKDRLDVLEEGRDLRHRSVERLAVPRDGSMRSNGMSDFTWMDGDIATFGFPQLNRMLNGERLRSAGIGGARSLDTSGLYQDHQPPKE